MRVIPNEERLNPPFLCFICETHPSREAGIQVVDTGWFFDPPASNSLTGKKYICSRCVGECAGLLGFVAGDAVASIKSQLEAARTFVQSHQNYFVSIAKDIERQAKGLVNIPFVEAIAESEVSKENKKEFKNGKS